MTHRSQYCSYLTSVCTTFVSNQRSYLHYKSVKRAILKLHICISLFFPFQHGLSYSAHPTFMSCECKSSGLVGDARKNWNFKERPPVATVDSHSRSVKIGGDSSHHLPDNVDTSSVDCRTHGTQVPRCDQTGARGAISIVCASDGERRSSTPYLKGLTTPPSTLIYRASFAYYPPFPLPHLPVDLRCVKHTSRLCVVLYAPRAD